MTRGWIAPEVAAEFPGLSLRWADAAGPVKPSPPELRERLRALSDRFLGSHAIALRSRPVAHAQRVFFRHIGLDPDVTRIPVEALALERLLRGRFESRSTLHDALTVAIMETGVGVWALDRDRVEGAPGIAAGADGRLVVADATRTLAPLFGAVVPGCEVTRATRRLLLYAVEAPDVPAMCVDEALWTAADILDST